MKPPGLSPGQRGQRGDSLVEENPRWAGGMRRPVKPKVTNAWSDVPAAPGGAGAGGGPGRPQSRIALESTVPPAGVRLRRESPTRWVLMLEGLSLNMPAGHLAVWDGVVAGFSVDDAPPDRVRVEVRLDHPAEARVEVREGLPARTFLTFDRSCLNAILGGRTVAVDPGHGGEDAGARGPINLVEKVLMLDVARRLAAHLEAAGARPVLTREGDEAVPAAERVRRARAAGADCLVSLHTGHDPRPGVMGTRTLFLPGHPGGRALAACLHRGVLRKAGRPDRGLAEGGYGLPGALPFPAVIVEAVCVANPLEEGWLRSPVFKDRVAQGIRNGLMDHFAALPAAAEGREAAAR